MSRRKIKFNEETREKILTAIRGGCYVTTAAAVAKVDRRTINLWREKGLKDIAAGKDTAYADFERDIEIAEAEGEFVLIQKVKEEKPLEVLKRRYRDRWGDSIKAEHTGPGGVPLPAGGGFVVNLHMEVADEDPWRDKDGNPITT